MSRRILASAAVCLSLIGQPVASEAQDIHSACALNMINSIKASSDPNFNQTQGSVFDEIPDAAASVAIAMHQPTATALIAIPFTPQDFHAVYGREPTGADAGDIAKAAAQTARSEVFGTGMIRRLSGADKSAVFLNFLRETPSEFPVIVGHNKNGQFVFLDGRSLSLVLMSKWCGEAKKVCIFISCRSKDYVTDGSVGVSRDLTMSEGVWLGNKIANWISAQQDPISLVDVRTHVTKLDRDAAIKYHVSFIVLAGCGAGAAAGGVGVYILIEGADSPDQTKQ